MREMALLEVRALSKIYKRAGGDFAAVDGVSLTLTNADFACVTGHSGSGKSTLLNMVAGLLPPTSGQVLFNGTELGALNDSKLSALRNTKIGYIPQGRNILGNLSVLENVRLPYDLRKRPGDPMESALELLGQMGIRHLAEQYPGQLSGGELRRVSIARGLINKPLLLIADEPTGDLDPQNSESVMELLAAVARTGTAVLLVTHETDNARRAGRHLHMEAGKLSEE